MLVTAKLQVASAVELGGEIYLDGSVVALWDGLRLQVTLQGAVEVAEQEPFQSFPVRSVNTIGLRQLYSSHIFIP